MRIIARWAPYVDLIPIVFVIALTFSFTVEVPASDDWDFVPIIQKMREGTLDWNTLDTPYGGHKITVPYLVLGGMAVGTHWNTYVFRSLNIALFLAAWLAIRPLAVQTGHLLAASIFFWSLDQWVAFLWNTPMCCTMALCCVLWSLRLLASKGPVRFVAAMVLAVIGTFCHGTGLAVWPGAIYLLFFRPRALGERVAFVAVLVLTIGLFLHHPPPLPTDTANNRQPLVDLPHGNNFLQMPLFLLQSMGATVGFERMDFSAVVAVGGLLMLFIGRAWERFNIRPLAAAILIAALTMLGMVMVARGGGSFTGQATDSRYGTMAALFWVAVIFLVDWTGRARIALAVLIGLCLLRSATRLPGIVRFRQTEEMEARGLIEWSADRFSLKGAHTSTEQLDEDEQLMREWHYSVFRNQ
jgi:hypothetical protein